MTDEPQPADEFDEWYDRWNARVRLPPGHSWCPVPMTLLADADRIGIDHISTPPTVDANGSDQIGFDFLQTGWLDSIPGDGKSVGKHLVAAFLTNALHELIEFVRVDGERLAAPHPPQEDQWAPTHEWMLMVVEAYIEGWPVRS